MGRFTGVLGIATILTLAYIFSTSRKSIRLKTVAWGLGLQLALGLFVLRVKWGEWLFQKLGNGAKRLLVFSMFCWIKCVGFVPRVVLLRS